MNTQQMEISFTGPMPCPRQTLKLRRQARAQWWFRHMRAVVNSALDWKPATPPRPEQIHLTLARRR